MIFSERLAQIINEVRPTTVLLVAHRPCPEEADAPRNPFGFSDNRETCYFSSFRVVMRMLHTLQQGGADWINGLSCPHP